MSLKVKGTIIMSLPDGEKVIVLLAETMEDMDKLYHYLTIDAYRFKNEIAEHSPDIKSISAGYKNDNDEVFWNNEYIPLPKWYDNN